METKTTDFKFDNWIPAYKQLCQTVQVPALYLYNAGLLCRFSGVAASQKERQIAQLRVFQIITRMSGYLSRTLTRIESQKKIRIIE